MSERRARDAAMDLLAAGETEWAGEGWRLERKTYRIGQPWDATEGVAFTVKRGDEDVAKFSLPIPRSGSAFSILETLLGGWE